MLLTGYVRKPIVEQMTTQNEAAVSGRALVALGLFWWWGFSVVKERQALKASEPASARELNQRIGRGFLVAPLSAFAFSYLTLAVIVPAVETRLFGKTVSIVARVMDTDLPATKACRYRVGLHLPLGNDFEQCLSRRLHKTLAPGDGLEMRARVYGAQTIPRGLRRATPEVVLPDGHAVA